MHKTSVFLFLFISLIVIFLILIGCGPILTPDIDVAQTNGRMLEMMKVQNNLLALQSNLLREQNQHLQDIKFLLQSHRVEK